MAPTITLNFAHTPTASSKTVVDLTFPGKADDNGIKVDTYVPLKNITIVNDGSTLLYIHLNQRPGYIIVPAGTIAKVEDTLISSYMVENASATTTGSVKIAIDNEDTVKSILRLKQ